MVEAAGIDLLEAALEAPEFVSRGQGTIDSLLPGAVVEAAGMDVLEAALEAPEFVPRGQGTIDSLLPVAVATIPSSPRRVAGEAWGRSATNIWAEGNGSYVWDLVVGIPGGFKLFSPQIYPPAVDSPCLLSSCVGWGSGGGDGGGTGGMNPPPSQSLRHRSRSQRRGRAYRGGVGGAGGYMGHGNFPGCKWAIHPEYGNRSSGPPWVEVQSEAATGRC